MSRVVELATCWACILLKIHHSTPIIFFSHRFAENIRVFELSPFYYLDFQKTGRHDDTCAAASVQQEMLQLSTSKQFREMNLDSPNSTPLVQVTFHQCISSLQVYALRLCVRDANSAKRLEVETAISLCKLCANTLMNVWNVPSIENILNLNRQGSSYLTYSKW